MRTDRETTRLVRSWLEEGATALPDRVLDVVLDQVPATPQRRSSWSARRFEAVNNVLKVGIAAAAVVVIAVLAINLLPGGGGPGGAVVSPSAAAPSVSAASTAEPSVAAPSSPADGSLPEGPFRIGDGDVPITIDIASAGWESLSGLEAVSKADDSLDPPKTVGVALLAWAWPAGTGINVYGDPCQWLTTIPAAPATTPDEIAAAFAAQASTDATAPVDVTVGGYAGKTVTLHVPMSYEVPGATREEEFADCDEDAFAFYGVEGVAGHARNAQGPGQVDELWILDVNGATVILDAAYGPAAPAEVVAELRTLAESATFE